MKNKIKNIKKCILTAFALITGVVASNAISDGGMVETSYASNINIKGPDINFKNGTGDTVIIEGDVKSDAAGILNSMIKVIRWITLIGTIVLLGIFIYNLIKMGAAGTNVNNRTAAQQALVWSGISAALLTVATSLFFFMSSLFGQS